MRETRRTDGRLLGQLRARASATRNVGPNSSVDVPAMRRSRGEMSGSMSRTAGRLRSPGEGPQEAWPTTPGDHDGLDGAGGLCRGAVRLTPETRRTGLGVSLTVCRVRCCRPRVVAPRPCARGFTDHGRSGRGLWRARDGKRGRPGPRGGCCDGDRRDTARAHPREVTPAREARLV
jgi:hypothetical protein